MHACVQKNIISSQQMALIWISDSNRLRLFHVRIFFFVKTTLKIQEKINKFSSFYSILGLCRRTYLNFRPIDWMVFLVIVHPNSKKVVLKKKMFKVLTNEFSRIKSTNVQ